MVHGHVVPRRLGRIITDPDQIIAGQRYTVAYKNVYRPKIVTGKIHQDDLHGFKLDDGQP